MTTTTINNRYQIRVTEDDGTHFLTVLDNGLIHTEAQFSGIAAEIALQATIDALAAALA